MKTCTLLGLLLLPTLPLAAQTQTPHPPGRTITVTGYGEVKSTPDQVTFNVTLHARNKAAADAMDQINTQAQALVTLLQKQEIDKKDLTTTSGGVYPEYRPDSAGKIAAYTANYSISIKFTDFKKATKVMAAVSGQPGVTNINGPMFGFEDPRKNENEALSRAVENAKSKALALAKSTGLTLKDAIIVKTTDASGPPRPLMAMAMESRAAKGVADMPIEPGEQTSSASVEITYGASLPSGFQKEKTE